MNSINIEIERIKKKFFIRRLLNEMNDIDETTQRYDYIKKIHDELTETTNNLGTILEEASNNVYTKKWNRMPNYHKIQKIREYMDDKYKNNPKRDTIEGKLIELVNDGKLNSCKFVNYDNEEFKILKITLSKTEIY